MFPRELAELVENPLSSLTRGALLAGAMAVCLSVLAGGAMWLLGQSPAPPSAPLITPHTSGSTGAMSATGHGTEKREPKKRAPVRFGEVDTSTADGEMRALVAQSEDVSQRLSIIQLQRQQRICRQRGGRLQIDVTTPSRGSWDVRCFHR